MITYSYRRLKFIETKDIKDLESIDCSNFIS